MTMADLISQTMLNCYHKFRMPQRKLLFVFGTRPEAIKLCPVTRHFRDDCEGRFDVRICVTAQHRDILDQVLQVFGVEPHYDLNAMRPGQTLTSATSLILSELEPVLQSDRPDLVLVQGIPPPLYAAHWLHFMLEFLSGMWKRGCAREICGS